MAKIKVNHADWNKLTSEQRQHIARVMQKTGLMEESDSIEFDATARRTSASAVIDAEPGHLSDIAAVARGIHEDKFKIPNPKKAICKTVCSAAEAAAVVACASIPGGQIAIAACVAVAHAAGEACRNKC